MRIYTHPPWHSTWLFNSPWCIWMHRTHWVLHVHGDHRVKRHLHLYEFSAGGFSPPQLVLLANFLFLLLLCCARLASTMTTSRTHLGLKILRHLPPSPARRSCVWGAYVGLIITIDWAGHQETETTIRLCLVDSLVASPFSSRPPSTNDVSPRGFVSSSVKSCKTSSVVLLDRSLPRQGRASQRFIIG